MDEEKLEPANTLQAKRPVLEVLNQRFLERIVSEALDVLRRTGVFIESEKALALLCDAGASVDFVSSRARIPEGLVWQCLRSVPASLLLYGRDGSSPLRLEGLEVHFNPGSAALQILDACAPRPRPPETGDLVRLARLTDSLVNIQAQSTALVPSDVPWSLSDRWRLCICLLHSRKPIITGTFTADGFETMRKLLCTVRGSGVNLRQRPLAIFDVCSSQPLRWSRLTVECLIECATEGIPAELISVPLPGATAPGTLAGALVQHTAENLSGVVIHQLAGAGSPLLYGGSPAVFDLRHGTVALGAAETMLMCAAYAQIGRFFGIPTHAYLGLSDAKAVDIQAGVESGSGAMTAALAGINVVSGAGMLEFENCQSLEKLIIDDEACGMALRLIRSIQPRGDKLATDLLQDLPAGDAFLTSENTLRWMREEFLLPGRVFDRAPSQSADRTSGILERARSRVEELLALPSPCTLPEEVALELLQIMRADARARGLNSLPSHAME